MTNTTTGTCGFCGRNGFKLPNGNLSVHGYNRPGYGFIEGQCNGSKCQPLEVSPITLDMLVERITNLLDGLRDAHRGLVASNFILAGGLAPSWAEQPGVEIVVPESHKFGAHVRALYKVTAECRLFSHLKSEKVRESEREIARAEKWLTSAVESRKAWKAVR